MSTTSANSLTTTFALSLLLVSSILLADFASASTPTPADCAPGHGCSQPFKATDEDIIYHNRKILMGMMGSSNSRVLDQDKAKYGVEMRGVPSGPDPLHHNNGPQRRPRISP